MGYTGSERVDLDKLKVPKGPAPGYTPKGGYDYSSPEAVREAGVIADWFGLRNRQGPAESAPSASLDRGARAALSRALDGAVRGDMDDIKMMVKKLSVAEAELAFAAIGVLGVQLFARSVAGHKDGYSEES